MLSDKGNEINPNANFSPFSKQKTLKEVKPPKKGSITIKKRSSGNKSFSLPQSYKTEFSRQQSIQKDKRASRG